MRFLLFAVPLSLSLLSHAADAALGALSSTLKLNLTSKDGTAVYAQATGNKNGPHIIFAHGLACTLAAFDPLFNDPKLTLSFYMVRYDTRGHGLSGKPVTPDFYTTDRYADDLKAVITAFQLKKPFFVGWSLGGAIAADIASNWPQPIPFSGLVWLAGLPYMGDILPKVATEKVLSFLPGLQETNDPALALQTRIDFVNTLSAKPESVPYATRLEWVGSTIYLPPVVAALALGRTQDPAALLTAAGKGWPLLILHGDADLQINGNAVIDNMKPLFKNVETHMIKGAGHIPFYDAENDVANFLRAWVLRISAANPY